VFVEPILPPQRLVILGAGNDVRPLERMAELLGWHIAVADGRAWLAQASRFPEAEQVLTLAENAGNLDELGLTDRDAVVLLTHSFDQDKTLLRKLLPLELRYLGLLGARNRSRILLKEVGQQLGWTAEQCLQRVHAPVGLDLGGDSPEAVALAILAEIQSVLYRKNAISRRMPEEALHATPDRPYVPTQCAIDSNPELRDDLQTIQSAR
jgi:xanthine dehydrogenase accessory factor